MAKNSTALAIFTILMGAVVLTACSPGFVDDGKAINSFEACAAAGYPIMESYPEQCRTPDGRVFVRTQQGDGSRGTIQGVVMLGPTCPVVQNPPDPNCADKPYQTELVLTTPDQSQVLEQFSSDINGRFRIDAPAGSYAIRSAAAANIRPYCSTNEPIFVRANGTTDVIVYCDTGIR